MYSNGPPRVAGQKRDDQLEHTYSSYVRIRDVALKTCQRRWTKGRSGERGSGISVPVTWHDDDDKTTGIMKDVNTKKNGLSNSSSNIQNNLKINFMYMWGDNKDGCYQKTENKLKEARCSKLFASQREKLNRISPWTFGCSWRICNLQERT